MSADAKETVACQSIDDTEVSPEARRRFIRKSYGTLASLLIMASAVLIYLKQLPPAIFPTKLDIHNFDTYKDQILWILATLSHYAILHKQQFLYPINYLLFLTFATLNSIVLAATLMVVDEVIGYQAFVMVTGTSVGLLLLSFRYDSDRDALASGTVSHLFLSAILSTSLTHYLFPFHDIFHPGFALLSSFVISILLALKTNEEANKSAKRDCPPDEFLRWGLSLYGTLLIGTGCALFISHSYISRFNQMTSFEWSWSVLEVVYDAFMNHRG